MDSQLESCPHVILGFVSMPFHKMRIQCGILFPLSCASITQLISALIREIRSPASFATASREFERRAKRFRVSTTGPTAFVSRVTRVFVNGVKRRFVFARSAQLTVNELTRISRIQIEFVQIREDSWTRRHPLRFRRGPKSPCASDHKK